MKTDKKTSILKHSGPFSIGVPALIWQVLFFYVPLVFMFFSTFIKFNEEGAYAGATLEFAAIFLKPTYLKVVAASLLLAFSNALICLCIAYPFAYFLAFTSKKIKNICLFLLLIPFWTNFLLHIYAWFYVLEKKGFLNNVLLSLNVISEPVSFLNSMFSVMIMMIYYYLPFMILPIYSSLERFDYKLIEVSQDLGASWMQTFRRVILPLTLRGVRAGFLLVYIPSFGEFAIPELMGGDKMMFVGSVVSHYLLAEGTGSLGSAFTIFSGIILTSTALLIYWAMDKIINPFKTSSQTDA